MEWTQDHKHSARGRFSTILRIFEGIFQKKIFHSMIMSNLALLDMLSSSPKVELTQILFAYSTH